MIIIITNKKGKIGKEKEGRKEKEERKSKEKSKKTNNFFARFK